MIIVMCFVQVCYMFMHPVYTNTHESVNVLQGKCSEAAEAISAQVSTWDSNGVGVGWG